MRLSEIIKQPEEEQINEDPVAMLGMGLVIAGFIGWAVQNWDQAKDFIQNRKYDKILADFQKNMPQETIKSFAEKLSNKLQSSHPASQKALAGRLNTINRLLTSIPTQEEGEIKLGFHLKRLQGEMRRAKQFVNKSNRGYKARKHSR